MTEFADWTRAFAMMGDSPVGYKIVLLAEDGSMYTLLQGEDAAGALQTVRLDSEGRLSAFIIDSSDAWGQMLAVGNAELAARLGSPLRYDRRGSIVVAEDFSRGFGVWVKKYWGTNAAVELVPAPFATGGYSVECLGSTGATAYSGICAVVPTLPSVGRGVSCLFSIFANLSHFEIEVYHYTGDDWFRAYAKYDHTNSQLVIYDKVAGEVPVVSDVTVVPHKSVFNFFKITFDTTAGVYKQLLFNDIIKDLSAYTLDTTSSGTTPRLDVSILLHPRSGQADKGYIDSAVVTINEP